MSSCSFLPCHARLFLTASLLFSGRAPAQTEIGAAPAAVSSYQIVPDSPGASSSSHRWMSVPLGPVALSARIPVAGIPAVSPVEATNTAITNPIGAPTGGNTWSISGSQFLAARFAVATTTRLVAATAEFSFHGSGNLFVAVVPLASLTALPVGASVQETPFNPGEVAFSTTFARANTGGGIETVPLNFDVPPGVYGIVFGSGFFGATGAAGMPPYFAATGSTGFLRNGPPGGSYVWRDTGSTQFNIGIVTAPAVATPVITAVTLPRQVVNSGQTLTLAATVTGATSLQWHRNGRPIAGATAASYTIAGAAHQRDAGWYRLVAGNASGATTSPIVFVNVAATEVVAWGDNASRQLEVPANLGAVSAVSAGFAHALALKADGTVVAWGLNNFGQTAVPAGLTDVVAIAAANSSSLALKADGTVVGWGNTTVPTGLAQVVALAADGHALALRADGTVAAWGWSNAFGQLDVPAGLNGVVGIAAAGNGSLALKADGTVVAWGSNIYGQANVPAGLANVVAVANADRGYALKADGTVTTWGAGLNVGQTRLPDGTSSVAVLAARSTGSSVVYANGTVGTWGAAIPPAGLDRVVALAQGDSFLLALRDPGAGGAPVITTQPVSLLVTAGQPATFSVAATGPGPLNYLWRRNGFMIPGVSGPTFTLASASRADADVYDVVVFPAAGGAAVTSEMVALRVAPVSYPGLVVPDPAWKLDPETDMASATALLRLPDGRIYVAGGFQRAGGLRRTGVLRLTPSGAVDASFVPPEIDNTIFGLAVQPDGRLLIAGFFSRVDGMLRPNLARLETDGRLDSTFNAGGSGPVGMPTAMAVLPDGNIVIGGGLVSTYNGTAVNRLVWLDADGTLLPGARNDPAGGVQAPVLAVLALPDGRLVVGGNATTSGGTVNGGLGILRPDGTPDPSFNVGAGAHVELGGGVTSLAMQPDGRLVAGGTFTKFNGQTRNRIVRLEPSGGVDVTFDPGAGFANSVHSLAVQPDGRIVVLGSMPPGSGVTALDIARLLPGGTRDPGFVTPRIATVSAAVALQNDGRVLVSGSFTTVGSEPRDGIARLMADGALDQTFDLDLRGIAAIGVMAPLPGGQVLLGRSFSYLRGEPVPKHLARFNADGTRDSSFNAGGTGATGTLHSLVRLPDGKLIVAGAFSTYNGTTVGRIARLHADGTLDTTFNAGGAGFTPTTYSGATVYSVGVLRGGSLIVGGDFPTYNGTSRWHLARLDPDGGLVAGFSPILSGAVNVVVVDRDDVYVAGKFYTIDGVAARSIARLSPEGVLDPTFNTGASLLGEVTALALLPDGRLLAAGNLWLAGPNLPVSIARLGATGAVDVAYAPAIAGGMVYSLHPQEDGRVIIRGSFTSVGGQPGTYGLARLLEDGTVDPSFAAAGFVSSGFASTQMLMTDSGRLFVPAGTNVGMQVTRPAEAPVITAPPAATTVFAGAPVTLAVGVGSSLPVVYRWFRDGVPLPGATRSALSLPAATVADAGGYRVQVTGELGVVTSDPVTLTVHGPPVVVAPPVARTVGLGGLASFQVVADGAGPFTYHWRRDGVPLSGATGSVLVLPEVSVAQAGGYTVAVTNPAGTTVSPAAALTVRPNPIAYSSLQDVGAGGTAGYFSIEGPQPKQVLLRAVGPGLPLMGMTPTLGDPHLSLHRAGGELFAANDNWSEGVGGALATVFAQVGAMGLATGSRDAALAATLPPGSYFIRVSGVGGTTGLALLELYDTDLNPASRLAYVALRGRVNAGGAFSAGLTMTNSAAKRLLIRAVGPALGHSTALADPRLRVYDGATVAADNDNWGGIAALATAAELAGAFALPIDSADAAVFIEQRVGSGVYTAEVSAGTSAGDVLLEFHDLKAAGASALAPLVVASPGPQTLAEDGAATLQVRALGREPLSYQWRRDGTAIPGATMSSLVLTATAAAPGGSYDVAIENPLGLAVSPPALVTVGNRATHALGSAGYRAGATVTIDTMLSYVGSVGSLGWSATLPDGWSYAGSAGAAGDVRPQAGDSGTLSWAWTAIPPSPVRFSFTVNVPATESGSRALTASAVVRPTGAAVVTLTALPDPLAIEEIVRHSADTDGNQRLGLIELTRVIELFNVRNGTTRTGAYAVAAGGSEDGFAPEPTRAASAVVTLARAHSADSNRDGRLSLLELTRVIEIYNFRSGTTRTGQYRVQPGTEDGFAPGP